ncbi:Ly6/PLAUR domain-containing protein 6 [Camelus dromedarius]|uniref:Ly6/PLAUR domain-containing protein 6 n=1 Tax=Camelus dromedarius TaxID=9838 RepID=A0A5N4E5M6_CAMDR|nr:Ly6/PLAUR domain-containing protein 6 [Camelus dromedarius]
MEAGPALAWLLLLSLLADCLKATQSRDFTVKDIVYLHPSTTPYPGGFKCFTCEKAADNYECNRWAPDIYCPRESQTKRNLEIEDAYPFGSSFYAVHYFSVKVKRNLGMPLAALSLSVTWQVGLTFAISIKLYFLLTETRYCYTQHTMEVTGNSISVTKRCVPLEDCLSTGCRDSEHEGHKVCTSCCEGNICNLPLPRNETDATFATTSPINQTNGHPHCVSVIVSCLWVWLGLTL